MEACCYGFAKRHNPFLVNTVVGFHRARACTSWQVTRAWRITAGKLTASPMGCDACYTNYMEG